MDKIMIPSERVYQAYLNAKLVDRDLSALLLKSATTESFTLIEAQTVDRMCLTSTS